MIIAGGCYHEVCDHPYWRAILGSGGRAAVALGGLVSDVVLETYYPADRVADLYPIEVLGIQIHASATPSPIAFAYFHSLSDPVISPEPGRIGSNPPIKVEGDVVLRFGFLEGTAIVNAERAIYDPQSAARFEPFTRNGSRAAEVAVVLNERELCVSENTSEVEEAAHRIISRGDANVLIAKGGIKGARLFVGNRPPVLIPAYRSSKVFKIGSGDVFSAAFAFYWGRERLGALEAAQLASRSVAYYCQTARLPLPGRYDLPDFSPVGSLAFRPVCIAGSPVSLGGRWLLEEARWRLQQLGITAIVPALDGKSPNSLNIHDFGCVLLLMDHLDETSLKLVEAARGAALPIVALAQLPDLPSSGGALADDVTEDFTTALYWAGWAAAQQ
jgi:hypothetical protein